MKMAGPKQFLLDANVLIEAKRRYYRFGLCPGFWECLAWHHAQGTLLSLDRIKAELQRGKDDLAEWADHTAPAGFFASTRHEGVENWFAEMVGWAQKQDQFYLPAKAEYAAGADPWLSAFAKEKGLIVVTHETLAPGVRNRVKIPNVCQAFDVEWIDTFDMLEGLEARFSWQQ